MTLKIIGTTLITAALMVGLLGASAAEAANPENVAVNATVNNELSLAVNTNTVALAGARGTTATATGALTTTVRTNNLLGYTLSVKASNANFTSAGSTDTIPVGNLTTGGVNVSTTDQAIRTTLVRTLIDGDTATWNFDLALPYVDAATYTNT